MSTQDTQSTQNTELDQLREISKNLSKRKKAIIRDPAKFRDLCLRYNHNDLTEHLGICDEILREARGILGIPNRPQNMPEPAWTCTGRDLIRTYAWAMQLERGLCPLDCPINTCEGEGGQVADDCPIRWFYTNPRRRADGSH